jgi:hypothetical protein
LVPPTLLQLHRSNFSSFSSSQSLHLEITMNRKSTRRRAGMPSVVDILNVATVSRHLISSLSHSPANTTAAAPSATPTKECINYQQLHRLRQEPLSESRRKFAYNRPSPECRTFNLPAMEKVDREDERENTGP